MEKKEKTITCRDCQKKMRLFTKKTEIIWK